jgi:hypothetical protein
MNMLLRKMGVLGEKTAVLRERTAVLVSGARILLPLTRAFVRSGARSEKGSPRCVRRPAPSRG